MDSLRADQGTKRNILGVLIDDVDYAQAVEAVIEAATNRRPLAVAALAVHGVMTAVDDTEYRHRVNRLDVVTADGQPVRWALRWLHRSSLRDRVYGPELMLRVCRSAAARGLPVFLYGSRPEVLDHLRARLHDRFPDLKIAGAEPSKFRTATAEERDELVSRIHSSGARIVFVGLGCPRQEVFAYEHRDPLSIPLVAVGAAFDYHAGLVAEPPQLLQRLGLQWAVRLVQDPRRLWRRYLMLNPRYLVLLAAQRSGLWHPDPVATQGPAADIGYA